MFGASDSNDVRQSLTLLTDALEILVQRGIKGDAPVKCSGLGQDITVMYYYQQNNRSKYN